MRLVWLLAFLLVGCVQNNNETSSGATSGSQGGDLAAAGILWKPVSESDGKLVVILSTSVQTVSVRYSGGLDTSGIDGYHNSRPLYRFTKPGGSYPTPVTLEVGSQSYPINNPSQRQGK